MWRNICASLPHLYLHTNDSWTVCMHACMHMFVSRVRFHWYTHLNMHRIGLILSFNISFSSSRCIPLVFIYKACDMMKLSGKFMTVSSILFELWLSLRALFLLRISLCIHMNMKTKKNIIIIIITVLELEQHRRGALKTKEEEKNDGQSTTFATCNDPIYKSFVFPIWYGKEKEKKKKRRESDCIDFDQTHICRQLS